MFSVRMTETGVNKHDLLRWDHRYMNSSSKNSAYSVDDLSGDIMRTATVWFPSLNNYPPGVVVRKIFQSD